MKRRTVDPQILVDEANDSLAESHAMIERLRARIAMNAGIHSDSEGQNVALRKQLDDTLAAHNLLEGKARQMEARIALMESELNGVATGHGRAAQHDAVRLMLQALRESILHSRTLVVENENLTQVNENLKQDNENLQRTARGDGSNVPTSEEMPVLVAGFNDALDRFIGGDDLCVDDVMTRFRALSTRQV